MVNRFEYGVLKSNNTISPRSIRISILDFSQIYLLFALVIVSNPSTAQVFKCLENGKISYSDKSCQNSTESSRNSTEIRNKASENKNVVEASPPAADKSIGTGYLCDIAIAGGKFGTDKPCPDKSHESELKTMGFQKTAPTALDKNIYQLILKDFPNGRIDKTVYSQSLPALQTLKGHPKISNLVETMKRMAKQTDTILVVTNGKESIAVSASTTYGL